MEPSLDPHTRRMQILEMIESGQITADAGLSLLNEVQDDDLSEALPAAAAQPAFQTSGSAGQSGFSGATADPQEAGPAVKPEILEREIPPDLRKWRNYWMVPLWIGVGITILGSLWMGWGLQNSGSVFWLICSSLWFALGVLVIVLAVQSRTAHWLHLRVQQAPGEHPQNIALSFPLPIGLTTWFLQTFRGRIPGLDTLPPNIDQILQGVNEATSPENPIVIEVDDDEQGEKVRIYIG